MCLRKAIKMVYLTDVEFLNHVGVLTPLPNTWMTLTDEDKGKMANLESTNHNNRSHQCRYSRIIQSIRIINL